MTPLDAPAHTRLFAEIADALDAGDADAKLWTPGFAIKHHTLGECLIDALATQDAPDTLAHLLRSPVNRLTAEVMVDMLGGEDGPVLLQLLLRALAAELKHDDADVRLPAMAAVAGLARAHADYHAAAGSQQDIDDDEEFRSTYALPGFEGIAR